MNSRIQSAFRCPAALTESDIAALVAAMTKDAAQANKRRKRLENAGGSNSSDAERNAAYRRRRAELRALKSAWN